MYIAHINEMNQKVQTVKEHSENTARLCAEYGIPALKETLFAMGMLHDNGKYQHSFQQRIRGKQIRVEHSGCGAIVAVKEYPGPAGRMLAYCIAGHHGGIPDGGYKNDTPDMSTLYGRLQRKFEDYSGYREELNIPKIDERKLAEFLVQDCENQKDKLIDKFAFFTRYCYSCLVDADSKDTANFCDNLSESTYELKMDFEQCLQKVDVKLRSFIVTTPLQRARALLQNQVFEKCQQDAEIYLMNMPTGSGKTLCSLKFALERVVKTRKKRIIYVIPYNSIIDQTAEEFEKLFEGVGDILRHQSSFSYDDEEDTAEDYRIAMKHAAENWDAPFVITTAVQFFESLYANKRGKLRKLHNMADSILIFDEAHLMPQKYLKPCLEGISYITRYLNSEAVFLTATMPDFRKLIETCVFSNARILDLVSDQPNFDAFQKCHYLYLGSQSQENIVVKASQSPSSLIIVNQKKRARELFDLCSGKCYHLSTYMTAYDRQKTIEEIKNELQQLEMDYPGLYNVPEDRRIMVVATSLIEAGVDLDFCTVFRERAGLDNILQAGGRCNREGKRKEAKVFVFDFDEGSGKGWQEEKGNITKGLMAKYEDISCQDGIKEYYDRLFFMKKDEILEAGISSQCSAVDSIPFRTYGESFQIIDIKTVSVIVVRDEKSRKLMEEVKYTGFIRRRELQKYALSVAFYEFEDLMKQHVVEDFGSDIWFLTNMDYYDSKQGILFEAKDYFA